MRKLITIDHKNKSLPLGVFDDTTHRLVRRVERSKHLLRLVGGYAYVSEAITYLKELGCEKIVLEETDTKQNLESDLDQWIFESIPWRDQVCLTLDRFKVI